MATHGWTGLEQALPGSVAEKVVREAECTALTIRPYAFDLMDETPEHRLPATH